jgi:FKBP-type peptidyl-prolyl cis-trans isomerase
MLRMLRDFFIPLISFLILSNVLVSCDRDGDVAPVLDSLSFEARVFGYANSLNIDSGDIVFEGGYAFAIDSFIPRPDDHNIISIFYEIRYFDGREVFIFNEAPGRIPRLLRLNERAVFPIGLDEGLNRTSIGSGGRVHLFLKPEVAYGEMTRNFQNIASDSMIHFLVSVAETTTDAGITSREDLAIERYINSNNLNDTSALPGDVVRTVSSQGGARTIYFRSLTEDTVTQRRPQGGDSVSLRMSMWLVDDSTQFRPPDNPYRFQVGANQVIPGLELAVRAMEFQERALFIIPSALAYGSSAAVFPHDLQNFERFLVDDGIIPDYVVDVPPFRSLVIDAELVDIY